MHQWSLKAAAASCASLIVVASLGTSSAADPVTGGADQAASSDTRRLGDASTTRVVLKVRGCSRCVIVSNRGTRARVRGGRAAFTIPTSRTRGLRLEVKDPRLPDGARAPSVVVRYKFAVINELVAHRTVVRSRYGRTTWAGTSKRLYVKQVRAERYRIDGGRLRGRYWYHRSAAAIGPLQTSRHGTID